MISSPSVSRSLLKLTLVWLSVWPLSCSAPEQPGRWSDPSAGAGGASTSGLAGQSGGTANPLGRVRCSAPQGMSTAPRNSLEAVQLLNALPKPTSVACFVESLPRPLSVYASNSPFSAQPALSTASPRVFIKLDRLWLSIVIDGEGSYLLEFGELTIDDPLLSIKGELQLPLDEAVAPGALYKRVQYGEGTVCGLCHSGEQRAENGYDAAAFSSAAYRPRPDTHVSIDALRRQHQLCDWQIEPHRCEMLSAVFDGGPVQEVPFPNSMPTFF